MKQSLSRVILYSIAAVAFLWIGVTSTSAGEVREADKLVHKALKERTKTFCRGSSGLVQTEERAERRGIEDISRRLLSGSRPPRHPGNLRQALSQGHRPFGTPFRPSRPGNRYVSRRLPPPRGKDDQRLRRGQVGHGCGDGNEAPFCR